jgi:hypothetical protein
MYLSLFFSFSLLLYDVHCNRPRFGREGPFDPSMQAPHGHFARRGQGAKVYNKKNEFGLNMFTTFALGSDSWS